MLPDRLERLLTLLRRERETDWELRFETFRLTDELRRATGFPGLRGVVDFGRCRCGGRELFRCDVPDPLGPLGPEAITTTKHANRLRSLVFMSFWVYWPIGYR